MSSGDLAFDLVTSAEGLAELSEEWTALWELCPAAAPFQHPAWLLAWWNTFGTGTPAAFVARRRGKLVGIAPLQARGAEEELSWIGSGLSDYQDVLAEGPWSAAFVDGLLAAVGNGPWRGAEFSDVPESSPLLRLPTAPRTGLLAEAAQAQVCPVLDLRSQCCRSGGIWAAARSARSVLAREAPLVVEAAGPADWEEHLEELFRLHSGWWGRRGRPGVLSDPAVRGFHRRAAEPLARCGALRLLSLRRGKSAVACVYVLFRPPRAYYYIGGADPELAGSSPGSVGILCAVEDAVAHGAVEFDFLRGAEPYKYRWGAVDRPTYRLRLSRQPTPKVEERF